MAPLNSGSSIYHQTQALYWRGLNGELLAVEGKGAEEVKEAWPRIWKGIESRPYNSEKLTLPSGGQVERLQLLPSYFAPKDGSLRKLLPLETEDAVFSIQELRRVSEERVVGMLAIVPASAKETVEFRDWAGLFVVAGTRFEPLRRLETSTSDDIKARETARLITNIFEQKLQNIAPQDQWITGGGRNYFEDRVFGFIERQGRVELCLPAFPCKSPNPQKTNGIYPDRAEKIALDVLRSFTQSVAEVYEPGAKIWLISDGHVFSDCIGVDDDIVDMYGEKLKEMKRGVLEDAIDNSSIEFLSLWDIFFANPEVTSLFPRKWIENVDVPHVVTTGLTEEAELCRKLLMATCSIDPNVLNDLIKGGDQSLVALYRGFARFMLEDLAFHPDCAGKSTSQRKKLSTKVAAEMIKRNQAYSNLIELLFPSTIRLSIHAHDNRGPKFGIRLFSKPKVRAIGSMTARHEPRTADLLHTPTPWHNCIIEVEGDRTLYLAKSRVAQDALAGNGYEGAWIADDRERNGEYFLRAKLCAPDTCESLTNAGVHGLILRVLVVLARCIAQLHSLTLRGWFPNQAISWPRKYSPAACEDLTSK